MKKLNLIASLILFIISSTVFAQGSLQKTVWKGIMSVPEPTPVELHFTKDSFYVKTDQMILETMHYKQNHDTLIISKLSGGSGCDTEGAKYKLAWQKKDDQLSFLIIDDNCTNRSEALINAKPFEKVVAVLSKPVPTPTPKKKK